MATVTVVNEDRPNVGWILAFFLLCFIFLNRECERIKTNDSDPKTEHSNNQLSIENFQTEAVHFNGERVKIGPCWTYQCRPNDTKAWITDKTKSDYVLAISNSGFPGETTPFNVEGVPTLKRINNEDVWVLTEVQVIYI